MKKKETVLPLTHQSFRSRFTPPHTCCMDELGTNVMPKTAAAWASLFGNKDEPEK
jgi:hypothetical protein